MFVTDQTISEIADDMQSSFQFTLHSQSSLNEIASVAREHLSDRGLPNRKSLSLVIAKIALMRWRETIIKTKG